MYNSIISFLSSSTCSKSIGHTASNKTGTDLSLGVNGKNNGDDEEMIEKLQLGVGVGSCWLWQVWFKLGIVVRIKKYLAVSLLVFECL